MQDFALEAVLFQVGKDLQRGGQGVAFSGGQQGEITDSRFQHVRKEFLEDALRSPGTDIYYVKIGLQAEGREVGPPHFVSPIGKDRFQEFVRDRIDHRFVVQGGCYRVDCYHIRFFCSNVAIIC